MKKSIRKIAFANIIICILMSNLYATTFYVATTGNNSNSGTKTNPFKTISYGVSKLVAGDTLYVRGGSYNEVVKITKNGTKDSPITICAFLGEYPVIDGGTTLPGQFEGLLMISGSYINISGFEIKNSNYPIRNQQSFGILLTNPGQYIKVSSMKVSYVSNHGIWVATDNCIIEDCEVFMCSLKNHYTPMVIGWDSGILIGRDFSDKISDYGIVRRCHVYNNYGEGLDVFEASHTIVEDCHIHDNWTVNLYLTDATYCTFQRNIVYSSSNSTFPLRNASASGIDISNEISNGNSVPYSSHNTIINNLLYKADVSLWSLNQYALDNTLIANNTFVDCSLRIQSSSSNNVNSQIRNNIFIGKVSAVQNVRGITFSNNCWSVKPPSTISGTDDKIGDALIARTGSTKSGELTSEYFKLLQGSPAIDNAKILIEVPTDFFNFVRGDTPDIGAHEYRLIPSQLVIFGVTASNKTYDGTTLAVLSGGKLIGGNNLNTVSFIPGTGEFADKNIGTGKLVTAKGYILSGANSGNYSLVQPIVPKADIIPKTLTFTITADTKVFDGNDSATLNIGPLLGVIANDDVSLINGRGVFENHNVGLSKIVFLTGFSIAGKDAGNYILSMPENPKADIIVGNNNSNNQNQLVINDVLANNKIYDGTNVAVLSGGKLFGIYNSDIVSFIPGTGKFADKNAGTGKSVTAIGYTLSGANSGNYSLVQPIVPKADIIPKTLTFTITADSKVFDGNDSATINVGPLLGVIANDDVSLINGWGVFENHNVGLSKIVFLTGFSIAGKDAGNYILSMPENPKADIIVDNQNQLVINDVLASNKIYDGTNVAVLSGGKLFGIYNSDTVSFIPGTGKFADKNAGTGKLVTAIGYTLSGANSGNYSLVQPIVPKADIIPMTLTFTVTADSKEFDGSDSATINIGPLLGVIANDDVSLINGRGVFENHNVGLSKNVFLTGFSIAGKDAGNYILSMPENPKADIIVDNQNQLVINDVLVSNKIYDGTNVAVLSGGKLFGIYNSDTVSFIPGTGKFADKNAGTGKLVTAIGYTLSGANSGNYSLVQPIVPKADIIPMTLTFTVTADSKEFDGSDSATINIGPLLGVIANDDVSLINGRGVFENHNVGLSKNVFLTGFSIAGKDAGNYILSMPENPKADITIENEKFNNQIYVPNVITPNGDGKNDVWQIGRIEQFPNNEIAVFDRQGLAVFKTSAYNNDWKGDYLGNGKILPFGNYYYIINLGVENGIFKGTISILNGF